MNKRLLLCMIFVFNLVFIFNLVACSHESKLKNSHIVTAERNSLSNTLFYSGTIKPLKTIVVPSLVDGAIIEIPFQYGEAVKAGQLLFVISSAKFLTDYKSALMQYIKAKSDFNNNKTLLSEAKFLYHNLLISTDDYKMKQSNYYAVQLTLLQAKDTLQTLLQQLNIKDVDLYNLSIADVDKITQAMNLKSNSENIRVLAPADGIILAAGKNDEENKKMMKGDTVKQGDVLALIGDMQGVSVKVKVNELTINQLKLGQKIKITGIAFPEDVLEGEIMRVDAQGETASGGLPTFTVEVSAHGLSPVQQNRIHVGMSAKVEMDLKEEAQIMLPIAAVTEKNGKSLIQIYDEKTGKQKQVAVNTGKTTIDSIAILSGLKAGEKIVVPN